MVFRQFPPKKIAPPPLGLGLELVLGWGKGGGGIFLVGNCPRTSLNIQKTNGKTH